MKNISVICLLFIFFMSSCSSSITTYRRAYRYYRLPSQENIRLESSELTITRKDGYINVIHRICYRVFKNSYKPIEVNIIRRLVDPNGKILSERSVKDVVNAGRYPNTLEFQIPIESLPNDTFSIQTSVITDFGYANDIKYLHFNDFKNPIREASWKR